jgi:DNA-directed RNA polymerase specialized sigma24 family protein
MNQPVVETGTDREAFDRLLGELRPKLHRYCARMTGSVIDGEDVVQETMIKALEAFPSAGIIVRGLAVSDRPQRRVGFPAPPR